MGWDWKVIATGSGLPFPSWLPAPSPEGRYHPPRLSPLGKEKKLGGGLGPGRSPQRPLSRDHPPRGSASTKASFPRGEGAAGNSGRSLLPAQPAREALIQ